MIIVTITSFMVTVGFSMPQYGHLLDFFLISLLQFLQGTCSSFDIMYISRQEDYLQIHQG